MSDDSGRRPAAWTAEVTVRVPFYDLDPMEVVWHGNYAKYFEHARCVVFDQIDYNYVQMKASGFAWPVIDMQVRFLQPATFGQLIIVRAELVEWENRLKLEYRIRDAVSGLRLTKGHTVQVAVDIQARLMCLQSPPILFEKLGIPQPC